MAKLGLIIGASLLVFVALASAEKQEPSFTYKASAEICRQYFDACRAASGGEKAQLMACSGGFMKGCFLKMRSTLDQIKECVGSAGLDLDEVNRCISKN